MVVTAGRGRVAVARYQWRKGKWISRGEPQLMDWATLFASVDGPAHQHKEGTPTAGGWHIVSHVIPMTNTATVQQVAACMGQNGTFSNTGSAQAANVDTVLVDGRILKRGGKLTAIDAAQLMNEASAATQAIIQRANWK